MTTEERPAMLTIPEAAAALRCTPLTVRRMCRRGELAAVLVAGRWLVPRDAIDALLTPNAER